MLLRFCVDFCVDFCVGFVLVLCWFDLIMLSAVCADDGNAAVPLDTGEDSVQKLTGDQPEIPSHFKGLSALRSL